MRRDRLLAASEACVLITLIIAHDDPNVRTLCSKSNSGNGAKESDNFHRDFAGAL